MRLEIIYYLILFVYVALWSCQVMACLSTHSLIILTDSYINIFRILDILLGIVHLKTQREIVARHKSPDHSQLSATSLLAGRLFDCTCTYDFKRLPLLGSFVNGLFLAALLMSAAIEGIQTCFHSEHSGARDKQSFLLQHIYTYPLTLIGFALIGLIMQYCSLKAHELREEELCSESLIDVRSLSSNNNKLGDSERRKSTSGDKVVVLKELAANDLPDETFSTNNNSKTRKYDLNNKHANANNNSKIRSSLSSLASASDLADENVLNQKQLADDKRTISLKSLKMTTTLETLQDSQLPLTDNNNSKASCHSSLAKSLNSISHNVELANVRLGPHPPTARSPAGTIRNLISDRWALVRFFVSPMALVSCATIILIGRNDLVTEICDACLAVLVVGLIYTASYPPMKKAGKVLLQTAPDGVEPLKLEQDLKSASAIIVGVRELKVWSLTPRSNRVATCQLVLDRKQIHSEKQIKLILHEARARFLEQNIKNTTIEPVLQ